jgi:hypothetical protein
LITIEYAFSGTVEPATNEAAGTVQIDVLYLDDSLTLDWTGSTDGDKLSLSFSGSGVFSNIDVLFESTVNVDLVSAE